MPHRILGVAANASPAVIKAAYRKLALTHHPDLPTGCPITFQKIQDSYDKLMGGNAADAARSHASSHSYGSHSHSYGTHWRHDAGESEDEAQRREYEQLRREWQRDASEEARRKAWEESPDGQQRKWQLLRVLCAWVGIGAALKLGVMQMTWYAREAQLRGDGATASFLSPVAPETIERRPVRVSLERR